MFHGSSIVLEIEVLRLWIWLTLLRCGLAFWVSCSAFAAVGSLIVKTFGFWLGVEVEAVLGLSNSRMSVVIA